MLEVVLGEETGGEVVDWVRMTSLRAKWQASVDLLSSIHSVNSMTSNVIVCSIPSVKWDAGSPCEQKRILIKFCIRWSVIIYQRFITFWFCLLYSVLSYTPLIDPSVT